MAPLKKWATGLSWNEGNGPLNFHVRLRNGWPTGFYFAVRLFGRWLRVHKL